MTAQDDYDLETLRKLQSLAWSARAFQRKLNYFDDWSHRSTFSQTEDTARKMAMDICLHLKVILDEHDKEPSQDDLIAYVIAWVTKETKRLEGE